MDGNVSLTCLLRPAIISQANSLRGTALNHKEAVELLEPYLQRIYECISSAVQEFLQKHIGSGPFGRTTHAGMIRDLIVARAKKTLGDDPEVRFLAIRGQLLFIIRNRVRLRFKKLDSRLRSRNVMTDQARSFLRQEQGSLPGLEDPGVNLQAGYRWTNDARTAFDVHVTCPSDVDSLQWYLKVEPLPEQLATAPFQRLATDSAQDAALQQVTPRLREGGELEREALDG
jgi:hypothetical protein